MDVSSDWGTEISGVGIFCCVRPPSQSGDDLLWCLRRLVCDFFRRRRSSSDSEDEDDDDSLSDVDEEELGDGVLFFFEGFSLFLGEGEEDGFFLLLGEGEGDASEDDDCFWRLFFFFESFCLRSFKGDQPLSTESG